MYGSKAITAAGFEEKWVNAETHHTDKAQDLNS
jgi:hypothetical protein